MMMMIVLLIQNCMTHTQWNEKELLKAQAVADQEGVRSPII